MTDKKCKTLKEELESYKDKYLRAAADLENYKKMSIKERADLLQHTRETLLIDFIRVVDDFEHALGALKLFNASDSQGRETDNVSTENKVAPPKIDDFYKGVELIYQNFLAFLESKGVKPFSGKGSKFDPCLHEVIGVEETKNVEEGIIISEVCKGYKLNDKVIRPAKVIVAKVCSGKALDKKPAHKHPAKRDEEDKKER